MPEDEETESNGDNLSDMAPVELKSGYKTTEFWAMVLLMVIAVLSMAGVITEDKALQTTNQIFAILAAFGYGFSRAYLKKKNGA